MYTFVGIAHFSHYFSVCDTLKFEHFYWNQEEFDDDDDWNPNKAAGVCLMLLAQCCEDNIINHVSSFIETNIVNEDWKLRDAAVMAFGEFQSLIVSIIWRNVWEKSEEQPPDRHPPSELFWMFQW